MKNIRIKLSRNQIAIVINTTGITQSIAIGKQLKVIEPNSDLLILGPSNIYPLDSIVDIKIKSNKPKHKLKQTIADLEQRIRDMNRFQYDH